MIKTGKIMHDVDPKRPIYYPFVFAQGVTVENKQQTAIETVTKSTKPVVTIEEAAKNNESKEEEISDIVGKLLKGKVPGVKSKLTRALLEPVNDKSAILSHYRNFSELIDAFAVVTNVDTKLPDGEFKEELKK